MIDRSTSAFFVFYLKLFKKFLWLHFLLLFHKFSISDQERQVYVKSMKRKCQKHTSIYFMGYYISSPIHHDLDYVGEQRHWMMSKMLDLEIFIVLLHSANLQSIAIFIKDKSFNLENWYFVWLWLRNESLFIFIFPNRINHNVFPCMIQIFQNYNLNINKTIKVEKYTKEIGIFDSHQNY